MNILFFASFFIYIFGLIFVGWIFSRRQKNSTDFAIGGRSINYWVTAIATQATDMSAWLFMALPGAVYSQGLFACWSAIGLLFFMFLTWQFVAQKLREATEKYQASTLSTYLEKRFNDSSGYIRIASASFALFFFSLYISAGIVALGRALSATFGFTYFTSIIFGTLTVALYTILGGFVAIAWNDFMQGMFVFFIVVSLPMLALNTVGGFGSIVQTAAFKNISLALLPDFSLKTIGGAMSMAFGWGLGYFGQPHILVNFMGIDNPQNIRKAKYVGLTWQIIALCAAVFIGLVGIPFFQTTLANEELVFIAMVKVLFSPLLAGLILCAILAAAITTMDSQILVSASMLTQDIYKKIFHRAASPKLLLTVSRISAVAIVITSFFFAIGNNESILSLIVYAWGGLGSTFGPAVLLSLYSKRVNRTGVLAGIIVGGLSSALWKYTTLPLGDYPIIPGFILGMSALLVGSMVGNKKSLK